MHNKGFTLIELVVVIVIIGVLAVIALPKFINLRDDANESVMLSMKSAIAAADSFIAIEIQLNEERLNTSQNRFTLENGETIYVRGKLADGRWNNTFAKLLELDKIGQVNNNNCDDESLQWCVRQRSGTWFFNRGFPVLGSGRGFLIFPYGNNVAQDSCYVYYLNQNDDAIPTTVQPAYIGIDLSGC
jgi:MSHA pilin protein MshA